MFRVLTLTSTLLPFLLSRCLLTPFISTALWTLSFCGTRQFHVVNQDKNWTDAQKYCRENFTDLATIESQEEMNALLAVLKRKTGYFWIGLRQKENCWTWSDGSKFSYSKWNSGEPNNDGTDNCGGLRSANIYRWNDGLCSYTNQFVCYNSDTGWKKLFIMPPLLMCGWVCVTPVLRASGSG
uniref:C-type lectin domain-containing protein n=1 Tax=Pygocentrus nattereri TaxID=42514 RepID=A0A3B4DSB4_PYGNA